MGGLFRATVMECYGACSDDLCVFVKVVVGGILKASAGPSWRPMTRLGGERPGISTALPVRGSDWLLRLSTSYEVRMACVPPAQTDSSRKSMHSSQLERLEAMSPRASERGAWSARFQS